ncbi:MAG: hypothetical protein KBD01_17200 [Acidobacteria bacterium]|nr:hypothetical protein [Acidobacteriota bacterium]
MRRTWFAWGALLPLAALAATAGTPEDPGGTAWVFSGTAKWSVKGVAKWSESGEAVLYVNAGGSCRLDTYDSGSGPYPATPGPCQANECVPCTWSQSKKKLTLAFDRDEVEELVTEGLIHKALEEGLDPTGLSVDLTQVSGSAKFSIAKDSLSAKLQFSGTASAPAEGVNDAKVATSLKGNGSRL